MQAKSGQVDFHNVTFYLLDLQIIVDISTFMEGLGKVQRLKRFMESCGAEFPKEADYGKRKNRQSKFITLSVSLLYRYLQITSGALAMPTLRP